MAKWKKIMLVLLTITLIYAVLYDISVMNEQNNVSCVDEIKNKIANDREMTESIKSQIQTVTQMINEIEQKNGENIKKWPIDAFDNYNELYKKRTLLIAMGQITVIEIVANKVRLEKGICGNEKEEEKEKNKIDI